MSSMYSILWKNKVLISIITGCVFSISLSFALMAKPRYLAETTVVRVESGVSLGALGQLGGLASLAGIGSLGGMANNELPMATLRSRSTIRDYLVKADLLEALSEFSSVDSQGAESVRSAGYLEEVVEGFERHAYFVSEDSKSGVVTVGVKWTDPSLAATWANGLVEQANMSIRQRELNESDSRIAFLKKELEIATQAPVLSAIAATLEAELQKSAVIRATDQYAFKIIDRAVAPTKKVSPKRSLICLGGIVLGFALSLLTLYMRDEVLPQMRN
jgi:uncharacterized protein involved in exopolysaccharide biosynthesis